LFREYLFGFASIAIACSGHPSPSSDPGSSGAGGQLPDGGASTGGHAASGSSGSGGDTPSTAGSDSTSAGAAGSGGESGEAGDAGAAGSNNGPDDSRLDTPDTYYWTFARTPTELRFVGVHLPDGALHPHSVTLPQAPDAAKSATAFGAGLFIVDETNGDVRRAELVDRNGNWTTLGPVSNSSYDVSATRGVAAGSVVNQSALWVWRETQNISDQKTTSEQLLILDGSEARSTSRRTVYDAEAAPFATSSYVEMVPFGVFAVSPAGSLRFHGTEVTQTWTDLTTDISNAQRWPSLNGEVVASFADSFITTDEVLDAQRAPILTEYQWRDSTGTPLDVPNFVTSGDPDQLDLGSSRFGGVLQFSAGGSVSLVLPDRSCKPFQYPPPLPNEYSFSALYVWNEGNLAIGDGARAEAGTTHRLVAFGPKGNVIETIAVPAAAAGCYTLYNEQDLLDVHADASRLDLLLRYTVDCPNETQSKTQIDLWSYDLSTKKSSRRSVAQFARDGYTGDIGFAVHGRYVLHSNVTPLTIFDVQTGVTKTITIEPTALYTSWDGKTREAVFN